MNKIIKCCFLTITVIVLSVNTIFSWSLFGNKNEDKITLSFSDITITRDGLPRTDTTFANGTFYQGYGVFVEFVAKNNSNQDCTAVVTIKLTNNKTGKEYTSDVTIELDANYSRKFHSKMICEVEIEQIKNFKAEIYRYTAEKSNYNYVGNKISQAEEDLQKQAEYIKQKEQYEKELYSKGYYPIPAPDGSIAKFQGGKRMWVKDSIDIQMGLGMFNPKFDS